MLLLLGGYVLFSFFLLLAPLPSLTSAKGKRQGESEIKEWEIKDETHERSNQALIIPAINPHFSFSALSLSLPAMGARRGRQGGRTRKEMENGENDGGIP